MAQTRTTKNKNVVNVVNKPKPKTKNLWEEADEEEEETVYISDEEEEPVILRVSPNNNNVNKKRAHEKALDNTSAASTTATAAKKAKTTSQEATNACGDNVAVSNGNSSKAPQHAKKGAKGGGGGKATDAATKNKSYDYESWISTSLFFVRWLSSSTLRDILSTCKEISNGSKDATVEITVNSSGMKVQRNDYTSNRWLTYQLDVSTFEKFVFDPKRTGYSFAVNISDLQYQLKLNKSESPFCLFVPLVEGENRQGQKAMVASDKVLLYFEYTDGGKSTVEVGTIDVEELARDYDPNVTRCTAVIKPLNTLMCERFKKYSKSRNNTLFLGVEKNVTNHLTFFVDAYSDTGTGTKNQWNLRADKGELKSLDLLSEEGVLLEMKTESINMLAKLQPFWENVVIRMENGVLMEVRTEFDNKMGKGSVLFVLFAQMSDKH